MEVKPGIDRRTGEVDVLEQVLKGVRTQSPERDHHPHVVDLSDSWTINLAASAVQVKVDDDDPDRR